MKKLSKQELIELVTKIRNVDFKTEEEGDELIELFEYNIIHPEGYGLIFHHKPRLTPEEIVEKALAYKPIELGGPKYTEEELSRKDKK